MISEGDNHYDIISAFIKSMRGSDPDAAVYYLAKMLYGRGGYQVYCAQDHDPVPLRTSEMQIRRHSVWLLHAAQAVERVGMPEAQIILSQAVTYMACAPKSNAAVNAIFSAMDCCQNETQDYGSCSSAGCTLWWA